MEAKGLGLRNIKTMATEATMTLKGGINTRWKENKIDTTIRHSSGKKH